MSDGEHTEAERLRSAEITLATLRDHAERSVEVPVGPGEGRPLDHARGYVKAMRDVLAIIDARELPEGAPVFLGEQP